MKLSFQHFAVIAIVFINVAVAQVSTGTPPFATLGGGPFDAVNLGNLNAHFAVPIIHKAGRAGLNFTYDLGYDSSVWYPMTINGQKQWQPTANWGWHALTEAVTGYVTYTQTGPTKACYVQGTSTGYQYTQSNWTYHDAAGAAHFFQGSTIHYQGSTYCPPDTSLNVTTTDGSGWAISATGLTLHSMTSVSGKGVVPPLNSQGGLGHVTDANGNQITVDNSGNFYDTLSSTTPVLTVTGGGTSTSPWIFSYIPPANESTGTRVSVHANYVLYTVKTNFGLSSPTINEYGPLAVSLLDNITLADGSRYTFTYESTPGTCTPLSGTTACVTARIQSVQLPTGATITYQYSGGANGSGIFDDGSTGTLTRTLSTGGTWTYARTFEPALTLITDPLSNQTQIGFIVSLGSVNYYEYQRLVYQGNVSGSSCSSTVTNNCLLATTNTCYNGQLTTCVSSSLTGGISRRTIFSYLPDSSGQESESDTSYNNGLVTSIYNYDYGLSQVGGLLSVTNISYGTANASGACSALGNGIVDHVCMSSISDGAGHNTATTYYSYDETAVTSPTGTTPQHISISGSRGNLTTLRTVVNSTSSLYRKFTNYNTGNVNTASDAGTTNTGGSNISTYNYPNATSTCGNAFPASVSEPLSLSRSFTWDCTGGVQTSATDENGKTSSVYYTGTNFSKTADPNFWRPYAQTDQLSTPTTFTYSTNTLESTMAFNNNSSVVDQRANEDGFGRVIVSQIEQGYNSANYDSVETSYDATGRPSTVTMPYVGTAGSLCSGTCPGTSTTYDALGRPSLVTDGGGGTVSYSYVGNDVLQTVGPTQNFKKQFEYDGLGRLKSVCELTSGTSSWPGGTCGQSSPQTGYWTTYAYDTSGRLTGVTQNAQSSSSQTRIYTYDSLGRLTSETNPETGAVNYTYDAACTTTPASAGDLTKRVDNAGNITCYAYDGLHRVTDAGYNGPTCRHWRYDTQTPPSGVTVANTSGRQTEAFTDSCSGNKVTDEWFGYDADGRLQDFYESTPNSGGYYHTSSSYWANGAIASLSALTPNSTAIFPTIYPGTNTGAGLDGEGRVTKVNAASGTNPLTGVTYVTTGTTEPIGALTALSLGSADSDSFTYDPSTGRPLTYTFSVNGANDTGTLTWNQNGTLGRFVIADSLASTTDSQTCNYYYDDLGRLAGADASGYSVDCGSSKWQQTFTLDPFGNIKKSGTSSFLANYSTSTNQISSGVPASYDANGNLLTDNVGNTYSWDKNWGNPASINTTNLTYDALGQMVEQQNGSTYTQILYSPAGKTAIMSGQTLNKAFIGLPGGSTAIYTASGLAYYRHTDWLGSSRLTSTSSRGVYFTSAYAPYGEQYASSGTPDPSFTGQNADTTPTLYDFTFRENSSTQGRWISPDPAGLAAADPANPQSWNRYAYVMNSPMALVDPLGFDCVTALEDGRFNTNSGDCPGMDPNNEYYINCDGCLEGATGGYIDYLGNLVITGSDGQVLGIVGGDGMGGFDFTSTGPGATAISLVDPENNGSFTKEVLPEGPYTNVCRSGQVTFLAPASFDMSAIVAAGKGGGRNPWAANAAVGHYGTFDFQRYRNSAGDTVFYTGYTNVSNFGVGAYLYGTGVPQWAASGISNTFALFKSSNAGDPNQATYRNAGYSTAKNGGQITCSKLIWGP